MPLDRLASYHVPLPQPEAPSTEDVRGTVQQALEEAQRLPEMPPFVDYTALLADVREWVEQLQGAASDITSAQQVRLRCKHLWDQAWVGPDACLVALQPCISILPPMSHVDLRLPLYCLPALRRRVRPRQPPTPSWLLRIRVTRKACTAWPGWRSSALWWSSGWRRWAAV